MKKIGIAQLQRGLTWAKYCIAGAIGGVALVNTVAMIFDHMPSQGVENIAIGVGAIAFGALVKILNVV